MRVAAQRGLNYEEFGGSCSEVSLVADASRLIISGATRASVEQALAGLLRYALNMLCRNALETWTFLQLYLRLAAHHELHTLHEFKHPKIHH